MNITECLLWSHCSAGVVCANIQKENNHNRSKYLIDPHKIDIFIVLPSQSRRVRHKIAL